MLDLPVFWTLNHLVPIQVHYMEKNAGMFSSKTLIFFLTEERKTSAKVFFKSELLLSEKMYGLLNFITHY